MSNALSNDLSVIARTGHDLGRSCATPKPLRSWVCCRIHCGRATFARLLLFACTAAAIAVNPSRKGSLWRAGLPGTLSVPDQKLVGQNYTPPDLVAKVTGRAKYAEDYRADGMLFTKLLLSPMPHARVRRIDTRAALAMPGVKAILTADDLPGPPRRRARADQRAALSGRADSRRRRDRRVHGRGGDRTDRRATSSRCRSSSIRSRACGPAARTRGSTATCGFRRRRRRRPPGAGAVSRRGRSSRR